MNMERRFTFRWVIALMAAQGLAASSLAFAAGQSSANFVITRDTLNSGVADMSSANFTLKSSLGDSVSTAVVSSASFVLSSGYRGQVSAPPAVLNLLSVVSRKFHNGTLFTLTIADQPITGNITVESRAGGSGGSGHTIVFHFDAPITAEGAATALDQAMNTTATVTLSRSGNDVIATLSNVADNVRLTLTLTGVNGVVTAARAMGFLVGDVNTTRAVTAADISGVKANSGNPVNSDARAKFDLNADGTISSSDITAAKARAGKAIQ
ncbi:MAG: hypothetical protein JNJ55_09190 [Betaproteobacteria bacterium]|nr:hypothetical protein [Betaproteobacteria bacterium]